MCSSAEASGPISQAREQVWGLRTRAEAQWIKLVLSLPRTSLPPGNSVLCFYGFFTLNVFPPDYSYPCLVPTSFPLVPHPLQRSPESVLQLRINSPCPDSHCLTLAVKQNTNLIYNQGLSMHTIFESLFRNLCTAFPKHTSYCWPLLRS